MPARFEYPCPSCRSDSTIHEPDCRFYGREWADVEKAYVDIIAVLSGPAGAAAGDRGVTLETLKDASHGEWDDLHQAALDQLDREQRIEAEDDRYLLRTPEAFREAVIAGAGEPIRTLIEKGSVPGAHDNAVFAMIAWYEMLGFSWAETKQRVVEWLYDTGTWERGGFEESSPEQLVDSKRHVYEEGYGWLEKAQAAKGVIERR